MNAAEFRGGSLRPPATTAGIQNYVTLARSN